MQFLYYALFAAGIVAVDPLSKYFTVTFPFTRTFPLSPAS